MPHINYSETLFSFQGKCEMEMEQALLVKQCFVYPKDSNNLKFTLEIPIIQS